MIKYPVKYRGYFDTVIVVEDDNGDEVSQCPSIENAETIASALNAMNEFPFHAQYYDNELTDWYTKYKPIVRE